MARRRCTLPNPCGQAAAPTPDGTPTVTANSGVRLSAAGLPITTHTSFDGPATSGHGVSPSVFSGKLLCAGVSGRSESRRWIRSNRAHSRHASEELEGACHCTS